MPTNLTGNRMRPTTIVVLRNVLVPVICGERPATAHIPEYRTSAASNREQFTLY
jgi:hypothetical protein